MTYKTQLPQRYSCQQIYISNPWAAQQLVVKTEYKIAGINIL